MGPFARALTAGLALALAGSWPGTPRMRDVLGWFTPGDQAAIASGRAVVEIVPREDVQLAVVGAVRTTTDGQRLVDWFREIEQLQRGRYIPIIQRFSNPPRRSDLDALVLDDEELEDLRTCQPRDCGVKLAAAEMYQVRRAMAAGGREWREAGREAFRAVVLARAQAYVAKGFAGTPPYDDRGDPVAAASEFQTLLGGCRLPGLEIPLVTDYLRTYPMAPPSQVESFLTWSRDLLGDAKPIFGITHVNVVRGLTEDEPTIAVATQVFATHYINASASFTAIVDGPEGGRLLVYARCVRTDVFRGPFGGVVRRVVQKRVRKEGALLLDGLRKTLEAGPPAAPMPK